MRTFFIRLAAAAALLSPALAPPVHAYESMQGPTETLLWDRARAFEGYTLFAAHGRTFLIDLAGNVVHTWNLGTNPKLLDDGHILDASRDDPSGFGGLVEVDWDGNTVWEYTERRAAYAPHHDFLRVFNPKLGAYTTMYIANRTITQAEALAAGADPTHGPYDGAQVDALVEVDAQGSVIWEWWFLDHMIQDDDPAAPNYAGAGRTIADWPGRLDVNLPGRPLRRDWLHSNSLDYNQELDQVVVNVVQGEFYVIDHGGTFLPGDPEGSIALAAGPAGDFLYRFGDPARYDRGEPPSIPENWTTASAGHKQIGGSHDAHWIRPGLPGAGHFLVFNNGQYLFELTNQSYVDEIAPYLDARGVDTGAYVDPPAAGYTVFEPDRDTHKPRRNLSKQLTWIFGAKSPQGMFSHIGGSAQRLPNGNTLICADTEGHLLEVTSGEAPELVWEYISPMTREGALRVMPDSLPMTNSLFRAYRFAPDHPAFAGRSLVPTGTITGRVAFDPDADPEADPEATPDAGQPTPDASPSVTPDAAPAPLPDAARPAAPDAGRPVADASAPVVEPDAGAGTACTCPSSEKSSDGCQTSAGRGGAVELFGLCALGGLVSRRRRGPKHGLRALLCLPLGVMGCEAAADDPGTALDAAARTPDVSTPDLSTPDVSTPDVLVPDGFARVPDVLAPAPDATTPPPPDVDLPELVEIPAGTFEMGDHSGLGGEDPRHPSDEQPLHMVSVSGFAMMRTEVTCAAYVAFLEAARADGRVTVVDGGVTLTAGGALLIQTRAAEPTSRVGWDGEHFTVLDARAAHPITGVRFAGAVAYAAWLSEAAGLAPCMDAETGAFDAAAECYRLPTEAEWEYAAVAGRTDAYPIYPWGDAPEPARANWPDSGDPFEGGAEPFTTPVGFYDGSLRQRADFDWPGTADAYPTADGRNPWGLVDLAGNAWEWVADWYGREYYAASPATDPTGPTQADASPMPDGLPYHVLRGGSWFNGAPDGHSRVSNRDPGYFRGPGDPNGPWHHIGFRLVRTAGRGGVR